MVERHVSAESRTRTLTHRGDEVRYDGEENVELHTNSTERLSPVLEWTCPPKFERMTWIGRRHPLRFRPRTVESFTGTADDDTVVELESNIIPIAGEGDINEQDYPVVRAVNVTQDEEVYIDDVDYAANEVTLAEDPNDGDEVKLYPIVTEGELLLKGYDQFGNPVGVTERWATPLETWHALDQLDPDTEVHIGGEVTFTEAERLAVVVESPHEIVWEDGDYPDSYVSTIRTDMNVRV